MSSKVELANIALGNIRARSITSFTEQSTEAEYVRLYYEKTLKALFDKHVWSFIRAEKALALLSVDLFDWAYCYQYPTDCLSINFLKSPVNRITTPEAGYAVRPGYRDDNLYNDLTNRALRIAYEVKIVDGNRVIGANEPDLWLDYRVFNDDPNTYSASFIDAFTWRLGAELAIPIVGGDVGRNERSNAGKFAESLLKEAIAHDLNNNHYRTEGQMPDSEHILIKG